MTYKKKFKKIIIHIGFDKTGSSAIQKNLNLNREDLIKNNIYYAPGKFNVYLPSYCSNNPANFIYNKLQRPNKENYQIHEEDTIYLNNFFRNINKIKPDYFIISYEGIAYLDKLAKIKLFNVLSEYTQNIEILGYVRNHLSFAKSSISERVKQGFDPWPAGLLPICPYKNILIDFIAIFGRKNVHIRLFSIDTLFNGDVVEDFLEFLSKSTFQKNIILNNRISNKINKSISSDAVYIGNQIRLMMDNNIYQGNFFYKKIGHLLERIDGDPIYLNEKKILLLNFFARKNIKYLKNVFKIDISLINPINSKNIINSEPYDKKKIEIRTKKFIREHNISINKISLRKRFLNLFLTFKSISLFSFLKMSLISIFIFIVSIFFKVKIFLRNV